MLRDANTTEKNKWRDWVDTNSSDWASFLLKISKTHPIGPRNSSDFALFLSEKSKNLEVVLATGTGNLLDVESGSGGNERDGGNPVQVELERESSWYVLSDRLHLVPKAAAGSAEQLTSSSSDDSCTKDPLSQKKTTAISLPELNQIQSVEDQSDEFVVNETVINKTTGEVREVSFILIVPVNTY